MLTACPECELQVSDKALSCPHCGYPLQGESAAPRKPRKSAKRRSLPNGFGQISEIKGRNLRKPFRAMVSVGKTPTGRPIVKPLKPQSYFETYNDAYAALAEYNKNPYDLNASLTVKQLYDVWSEKYFKTFSTYSSTRTVTSAWAYCSEVYDMRVLDLRARHIKGCMEDGRAIIKGIQREPTAGAKGRIKSLFNVMLDYALEYEIVDRNYARTFSVSDDVAKERESTSRGHIPFTDAEMQVLWENVNTSPYVDVVLIQCYMGWRPQELGLLKLANVDLDAGTIVGGMKTEAGTDRVVPIHARIRPLIEQRYREAVHLGSEYLINCTHVRKQKGSCAFIYDKYRTRFTKIKAELALDPQHRPHDGRIHFVTMAKKYNVDEYAIKYIVGHTINDITEKVYTQREASWYASEMAKIR